MPIGSIMGWLMGLVMGGYAVEIPMVSIPAGSFWMGGDGGEDTLPRHYVTLKGFKMGTTEVTQGQWRAVMGSNPSAFASCGENCPVESVSWNDIQTFIQKLNRLNHAHYALPTEAQWEYAARGGTTTAWSCGNDPSCVETIAWYDKNAQETIHPVAHKQPNGFGLYDMNGNVWEWTKSCYTNTYGSPCLKQLKTSRGGSWSNSVDFMRTAFRVPDTPESRFYMIGFRLIQMEAVSTK
ncbi:MAG: formylglycine-generating enzyme family protein [Sulfuricurvum sp.]